MPATSEDRLFGLTTSVAVKPPVAISADYNVTTFGEQTITSSTMTGDRTVTTTQDMRVLLMNQDDKRDNGIWMAGPVTWRRAPDFDGSRDAVDGTLVFSIYGDCWQVEGTNPIRIGYDEISFRSTYPFSEELNLYQRTIRTLDLYIEPLPSLSEAEGKTIVVQSGVPRWVTPESGTATDVLTELAKSDGATKIGSQQPDGKSETVQQALSAIRKAVGSVNTLVSRGRVPALSGHNQGTAGIQMYETYNNGYPTPYGNVIHLKGASTGGEGELLIGWSGTSISGAHAPVYIRSRRDVENAPWSAWAQVFTANELAGIPLPFPGSVAPSGWLKCNGQTFDTAQYPVLASRYPSGQLPDLRGEFIRGWDDGRKVDVGRNLLSAQGDAIRNITGKFANNGLAWAEGASSSVGEGAFTRLEGRIPSNNYLGDAGCQYELDISKVVPTANENRPRNIAFNYIVRAA